MSQSETQKSGEDATTILPLYEVERRAIKRALDLCNWNRVKAAEALQIGKATIYRKIKQYEITRPCEVCGCDHKTPEHE